MNKNTSMAHIINNITLWVPWVVGASNAGMSAYYVNNFPRNSLTVTEDDNVEITGSPGAALMSMGALSVGIQAWGFLDWMKYVLVYKDKRQPNMTHITTLKVYLGMMFLFYLVNIVLGILNIVMVSNYGNLDIVLNDDNGRIGGAYGMAVESFTYISLIIAAGSLATFIISEVKRTDLEDRLTQYDFGETKPTPMAYESSYSRKMSRR